MSIRTGIFAVFLAAAVAAAGASYAAMMRVVLADPGNVTQWRAEIGTTLEFLVIGGADGSVWGSGVYTDDSDLGRAAVHAGLLAPGEPGLVTVEIIKGLSTYKGTAQNGVESGSYGPWQGSFSFVGDAQPVNPDEVVLKNPGNLMGYRGQDGLQLTLEVEGTTAGAVWGTDVYTDDSQVGVAAVHAGLLQPEELGLVRIVIGGPQDSFEGSERNGISTGNYGAYDGSFSFVADAPTTGGKIDNS